ncbi:family 20 glycosylhydrolase [Planosporangium flavigriseum]|uniref:beta-N-acetylhexosaminidase n=1 Tax=Planosporangium flavigriseum TaxID=373681 RepID=A0A8J3LQY4_9ACTN|nr:beta-N-acetylhexosaminidase [Planosporangium flavigriseum]NJC63653.1 family 20 glycosylhydrolase [Planosporangium flavigriseum]GIG72354.1 beta-N-acetylhexosaminidase [Planosporangium flavigriseum]
MGGSRVRAAVLTVVLAVAVALVGPQAATAAAPAVSSMRDVVPAPLTVKPAGGTTFTLRPGTPIFASGDARDIGGYLAGVLRRSTGYRLPVVSGSGPGISLLLTGADPSVGDEGYRLDVTSKAVVIRAQRPAGLFAGVQTLRQLLPPAIESAIVRKGPWVIAGGQIVDRPRLAYRGAMLDVARHFHPVGTVLRYIDELALYKINHLHLHLTDDQGWRIAIDSWPRLSAYGGSTQVGGGAGGYFTKADYARIVAYAKSRYITVVPEVDMPGHVNAALASYAELNCDGKAPPLYTGIDVGFSSLCVSKEITYRFIDDVVRELVALTPGPYLHIGGDEAHATKPDDYATFMDRVQKIVAAHGKSALAWHQVVNATPLPSTVGQYWGTTRSAPDVAAAAGRGTKLLLSPANKAYLDMKYDPSTPLGLSWAGYVEVKDAYDWDPGAYLDGVSESSVFGVEAPLWTETIATLADIEYMAFPRLPAIAELGWSPASAHDWTSFRARLATQGPRWEAQGINFYRSSQVFP